MQLFDVFCNESSLANILPFSAVLQKIRITTNTDLNPAINMHLDDGTSIMFKQWSGGLYYYSMTNMEHTIINSQVNNCAFLKTV